MLQKQVTDLAIEYSQEKNLSDKEKLLINDFVEYVCDDFQSTGDILNDLISGRWRKKEKNNCR